MSQTGVVKTCVRCGLDVAGRPRAKDAAGRYFCEPCWRARQTSNAKTSEQADVAGANTDPDDGLISLVDASPRHPTHVRQQQQIRPSARSDQVSFDDNFRRPPPGGMKTAEGDRPIPDYLAEIAKWERRLLWVIVLSMTLGLIPPLFLILIPVYAFVTFRLARSIGQSPWPWVIGTFLPYAGIVVLIVLNVKATGILRAAGLNAPMFRSWRWER